MGAAEGAGASKEPGSSNGAGVSNAPGSSNGAGALGSFGRWSPAIFWCVATGSFCVLLELGGDLRMFGVAIGLAAIAGWLASLSLAGSLISAAVAGYAFYLVHPALATIALL